MERPPVTSSNEPEIELTFSEAEAPPLKRNHALTAALIGGAAAATAGAVWSARALARRNGAGDGKPLNAVMKTACTASEVAHHRGATDPKIQPSAHPIPEKA